VISLVRVLSKISDIEIAGLKLVDAVAVGSGFIVSNSFLDQLNLFGNKTATKIIVMLAVAYFLKGRFWKQFALGIFVDIIDDYLAGLISGIAGGIGSFFSNINIGFRGW